MTIPEIKQKHETHGYGGFFKNAGPYMTFITGGGRYFIGRYHYDQWNLSYYHVYKLTPDNDIDEIRNGFDIYSAASALKHACQLNLKDMRTNK